MSPADILAGTDLECAARDLIVGNAQTVGATAARIPGQAWRDLLNVVSAPLHPMLEFNLSFAHALSAVPEHERQALTAARKAALISDLQRRSVLRQVVSTLAAHGIAVVALKGAATAHALYPKSHLRPMTDIDMWLPDGRLMEAMGLLVENGFELPKGASTDGRLTPALDQRRLLAIRTGVVVELHGSIHSLQCLSQQRLDEYRASAVPLSAHGIEMRMLRAEDALVHTCLHLASTNRFANSRLPLLDVFLIVTKWQDRIDWVAMAEDARAEEIAVYLTLALTVARDVWSAPVPQEFFDTIGEVPTLPEMRALAHEQIRERNLTLPSALESAFRQPGRQGRLTAIARRALSSPSRLVTDLTVKIPGYARAWARGDLSGGELRRRAGLAERRGRIGFLAREAEAQVGSRSSRAG